MRELTSHKINGCNDAIRIDVMDEPGPGGACHEYMLQVFAEDPARTPPPLTLAFQNGPIKEAGTNGITHEALLAVLIDRLEGFQAGSFANKYNADALLHLRLAQDALLKRTRERLARGVEGTLTV